MKKKIAQSLAIKACALGLILPLVPARAGTLTTVPMQGTMVMPGVVYNASDGTLRVQVDPTVPQLTPLLVSNPVDCFNHSDPWCDALDPCRQGLAFSRRYGFVMAGDPTPAGTGVWIRLLSKSPGLEAYRYRTSPPTFEPIFGTAGSTNVLQWSMSMFHPAFTARPGTGTLSASFEAFLVNASTGAAVPGVDSAPFTLTWTVVPDGRPALTLELAKAQSILITWPAAATNYVLESADTLPASAWTPVTNAPVWQEGKPTVLQDANAAMKFFRLRRAP